MKYIYIVGLILSFSVPLSNLAQVCAGDFLFSTQSEMDQFLIDHPSCTIIDGDVTITNYDMITGLQVSVNEEIVNVDALNNITEITGTLFINRANAFANLTLTGLSNLTTLDFLWIGEGSDPDDAMSAVDISGLVSMQTINHIKVDSQIQQDLSPLSNITNLVSLTLNLSGYDSFPNIFPNLLSVEYLDINSGISGGAIYHLSGFNSLISANMIFFGDTYLSEFDAFHNLQTVESFNMIFWSGLTSFSGFENLENAGYVHVEPDCDCDINLMPKLSNCENLTFLGKANNLTVLDSVTVFSGSIYIGEEYLNAVKGNLSMASIMDIQGNLTIVGEADVYSDTAVYSAPNLMHIGGAFALYNTSIESLDFLQNVISLDSSIVVSNNPNLTECAFQAVCERIDLNPELVSFILNGAGCASVSDVGEQCSINNASGRIYADLDCDGVFNNADVSFTNQIIFDSGDQPLCVSDQLGNFYLPLQFNATTTFSTITPSGFLPLGSFSITTDNNDSSYVNNDFAFCPDPSIHDLQVNYANFISFIPGYYTPCGVYLSNLSANSEHAIVTFDFSNMPGITVSNAGNGTIVGNTIVWDVPQFDYLGNTVYYFNLYLDPTIALGTILTPTVTISIDPDPFIDNNLSNNVYSTDITVVGSYDPNDISVNVELFDFEELTLEGLSLDYTIRFQNTGTAPADFVRITDIIEEDLNLGSIEILSSSHSFQLSFNENREVEWLFDNIQLPDSASDEQGSHGFIQYRIRTNSNIAIDDLVENTASIYFDYNEPIITNTANTSFYVCPAQVSISGVETICQNEDVTLTASENWNTYSWTLNGNQVSSTNEFYSNSLNVGSNELQLEASTDLCSSSTSFTVEVFPTPTTPVITQNGNTLTATGTGTYTWTLNGEVLSDTDSSIEITETGNYGVSYVDDCTSLPVSGLYEFVGVIERSRMGNVLIAPNPSSDFVNITLPAHWIGRNEIKVTDAAGRLVMTESISSSKTILDASALQNGCYQIFILNTQSSEVGVVKWMIE